MVGGSRPTPGGLRTCAVAVAVVVPPGPVAVRTKVVVPLTAADAVATGPNVPTPATVTVVAPLTNHRSVTGPGASSSKGYTAKACTTGAPSSSTMAPDAWATCRPPASSTTSENCSVSSGA